MLVADSEFIVNDIIKDVACTFHTCPAEIFACCKIRAYHDDIIKWKHFPRYWPLYGGFIGHRLISTQRPVTRNFDVFFDLRPNKRLSKQWWCWWFETPSGSFMTSLWCSWLLWCRHEVSELHLKCMCCAAYFHWQQAFYGTIIRHHDKHRSCFLFVCWPLSTPHS